jgi:hypothetical protein
MHWARRFAQAVRAGAAKAPRGGRAAEHAPPGEQAGIGQRSVSAGKPRRGGGRVPKARRSGAGKAATISNYSSRAIHQMVTT